MSLCLLLKLFFYALIGYDIFRFRLCFGISSDEIYKLF